MGLSESALAVCVVATSEPHSTKAKKKGKTIFLFSFYLSLHYEDTAEKLYLALLKEHFVLPEEHSSKKIQLFTGQS